MFKTFVKLSVVALCSALAACAGEPKSLLDQLIKGKNFIPFQLPMESTRVGTLVRGNSNELYLVARPEKCFPDFEGENSLRWLQSTDLPQQFQKIEFSANVNINSLIGIGNETVKFKTNIQNVKTVEIQFRGAMVEFLDEGNFLGFYESEMGSECRRLLTYAPFIAQGLRIESMSFIFRDEKKGEISLEGKVQEFVDIGAGVKWHVQNNYSLVIETPKYIGYRMGKLQVSGDERMILYASTTTGKGDWIFKRLDEIRTQKSREKSQGSPVKNQDSLQFQKVQDNGFRFRKVVPAEPLSY
jgi:hypothetical protein